MNLATIKATRERAVINQHENTTIIELCNRLEQMEKLHNNLDLQFYFHDSLQVKGTLEPFRLTAIINMNGKDYKNEVTIQRNASRKRVGLIILRLIQGLFFAVVDDFMAANPQVTTYVDKAILRNFE